METSGGILSIMRTFTSDNLFLITETFALSLKLLNIALSLILTAE